MEVDEGADIQVKIIIIKKLTFRSTIWHIVTKAQDLQLKRPYNQPNLATVDFGSFLTLHLSLHLKVLNVSGKSFIVNSGGLQRNREADVFTTTSSCPCRPSVAVCKCQPLFHLQLPHHPLRHVCLPLSFFVCWLSLRPDRFLSTYSIKSTTF